MGYAWSGACYETTATALEAFAKSVPTSDAAGINSFTSAPTISATGLITWSISNRPLTATAATTRTGTTQLQACTYDSFTPDQIPDLFFVVAMVFAFFIGFRSGQSI